MNLFSSAWARRNIPAQKVKKRLFEQKIKSRKKVNRNRKNNVDVCASNANERQNMKSFSINCFANISSSILFFDFAKARKCSRTKRIRLIQAHIAKAKSERINKRLAGILSVFFASIFSFTWIYSCVRSKFIQCLQLWR